MKRVSLALLLALLTTLQVWGEYPDKSLDQGSTGPATLKVWGREIAVFRATVRQTTPKDRAHVALERMTTLSDTTLYAELSTESINVGDRRGIAFSIGPIFLFGILEEDLNSSSGETLEEEAEQVLDRLQGLQGAWKAQRQPKLIIRGVIVSILVTAGYFGLLRLLLYLHNLTRKFMLRRVSRLKSLKLEELDLRVALLKLVRLLFAGIFVVVALLGAIYWIKFTLYQFPYTAPWALALRDQIQSLGAILFNSLLSAIPNLLLVVLIFFVTRWSAGLTGALLKNFEGRDEDETWFAGDTARATRRLVVVLVWITGLVIAFPFIPGSSSAAFRGIGVMLGLMISLGSSGVVNQVMSGFVALYSGAVHSGEYAKVGDVEGSVTEVGFLATKILTPKNEYITVPNSVLVSDNIINYSRIQGEARTVISTMVTIGYDTPWRQVQAMLLLAAERTPGVRKDPAPSVRQTALSDYYIEYSVHFAPVEVKEKNKVISELHLKILDVFNEFNVQITSPNYVADPPESQVIPKEEWAPAPADPSLLQQDPPPHA
jgi:small-conductance mechanosensitive channel